MSPKTCGAEHARAHLPELLDAAHQGTPTIITKRGRPYAALVPLDRADLAQKGPSLLELRGTGVGMWGKSSSRTIARMRNQWR
jgi:prevent-host-death family protein